MTTRADVIARLTAAGPFELVEDTSLGYPNRIYRNAPPSLRAVLEGTRAHGDRIFLIYGDETAGADASPEDMQAMFGAYMKFGEEVTAEGILRGGDALQPSTSATMVRVRNGETLLSDGPFAETREQLGGFYMVECDTLDQAIDAARRIPGALTGAIEVRPIMELD